jgi:hypothetical protein
MPFEVLDALYPPQILNSAPIFQDSSSRNSRLYLQACRADLSSTYILIAKVWEHKLVAKAEFELGKYYLAILLRQPVI